MLPRMIHRVLTVILILLPLVILWLLPLHLPDFAPIGIVSEISSSAPRWVDNGNYGTCSAAMSGTLMSDHPVAVDATRAASIGAGVIESQTDLHSIAGEDILAIGPTLVQRQFPDGQSHIAWIFGQGRMTRKDGMEAAVEFVYIDATKGDPLLLISMSAGDPNFTCPELLFSRLGPTKLITPLNITVVISALYLLIVSVITLFLWRRRRRTRRVASAV